MIQMAKHIIRKLDDSIYEQFNSNRILFVVTSGAGFSCQAPVIRNLTDKHDIKIGVTTDRVIDVQEIDFASEADKLLFMRYFVSHWQAKWMKWNLLVNSHLNGFFTKRNALRVYMHHGTSYGSSGSNLPNAEQHDIYFGLSMHQKTYFEKLSPGLFYSDRAFFPIGSPKTDSLTNNKFSRDELLARLGLANRFTIVITSHWSKYSTLSIFTESIFRRLAEHFPDFNIIQTGHPWLWTENKNTNFNDCMKLKSKLQNIANEYDNAYFIPGLTAEELFPVCDMLVADHSSVITMFSLLDRPIVFFNNLEARANKVGKSEIIDLYINASETFSELDGLVQACVQSKEMHEKKKIGRQRLRDAFFVNIGNSSEVAAEVLSRIGGVYSPKSDRWPSIIEFSNAMCKKYS